MVKWTVSIAAIAAAIVVQSQFTGTLSIGSFAGVMLLAAAVFVWATPPPAEEATIPIDHQPRAAAGMTSRPWWAISLTAAALLTGAAATRLLWNDLGDPRGLLLWATCVALLLLAWWWAPAAERLMRNPVANAPTTHWLLEALLLFLIVLAAFWLRWRNLSDYPIGLQSDESNNARDALKWLAGSPYTPFSESNMGQASLFTYWIALLFRFLGANLETLRLASVVAGVLTVAMFYGLARDLFRTQVALLVTALFAVDRWHLTFSRIAYELILTPLSLILVFRFLRRGMQERRGRDWVCAGLALAFGFNTYTAFRVAVLGFALYVLFWLVRNYRRTTGNLGLLLLAALGATAGLLPLAIYAIHKLDVVLLRTKELSIFSEIAQKGSYNPLWFNLKRYLAMFNLVGDPAPLNNLPGEPMLSLVVGALAVVGLVYALRYWRRPDLFMLLAGVVAVLPAGILTVTVETPSARRVIGLLPVVYLLVGVVADGWLRLTLRTWRRNGAVIWQVASVLLAAQVASSAFDRFFHVQVTNPSVARAFNIVESSVGVYLAALDATTTDLYLDPAFAGNNIVNFLGNNPAYTTLSPLTQIPIDQPPADKRILFVLQPGSEFLRPIFQGVYRNGLWMDHREQHGDIVFHTFEISAEQVLQTRGLNASYFQGAVHSQSPVLVRTEAGIGKTLPPLVAPYTVVWSGSLSVPAQGMVTLTLTAGAAVTLTVDNVVVGEVRSRKSEVRGRTSDFPSPTSTVQAALPWAAGLHSIRVEAEFPDVDTPQPRLTWAGPFAAGEIPAAAFFAFEAPPIGLIGAYYASADWQGPPSVVRRDLALMADETMPDTYSVIWRGKLYAPDPGLYVLGTTSDDGSLVFIDGKLVVDNGGLHGANYAEGVVELIVGFHDIEVHYQQVGGSRTFELLWQTPTHGRERIPVEFLLPSEVDTVTMTELIQSATASTQPAASEQGAAGSVLLPTAATTVVEVPPERFTVLTEVKPSQAATEVGTFLQPRAVAVGPGGEIYVGDVGNRRLVALNPDGALIFEIAAESGQIDEPVDIAVDGVGLVYVLDAGLAQITVFNAQGGLLRIIKPSSELVARSRGFTWLADGTFWLASTPNAAIAHIAADGELLERLPLPGRQPVDVAVGANGVIYVTDVEQKELLLLNSKSSADAGGSLEVARLPIPGASSIDGPHLALDASGIVFLSQPEEGVIARVSASGDVLERLQLPRLFGVSVKPVGISVDATGAIWIADSDGDAIWKILSQ